MGKLIRKDLIETDPKEFARLNSYIDCVRAQTGGTNCLNWRWGLSNGYAQMSYNYNGKKTYSRIIKLITNCSTGKVVRHLCDNKACINPDHLEPGTQKENNRDKCKNGDCSHCEDQNRRGKIVWSHPTLRKLECCHKCYYKKFKSNPWTEEEYDQYMRDTTNKSISKKRLSK